MKKITFLIIIGMLIVLVACENDYQTYAYLPADEPDTITYTDIINEDETDTAYANGDVKVDNTINEDEYPMPMSEIDKSILNVEVKIIENIYGTHKLIEVSEISDEELIIWINHNLTQEGDRALINLDNGNQVAIDNFNSNFPISIGYYLRENDLFNPSRFLKFDSIASGILCSSGSEIIWESLDEDGEMAIINSPLNKNNREIIYVDEMSDEELIIWMTDNLIQHNDRALINLDNGNKMAVRRSITQFGDSFSINYRLREYELFAPTSLPTFNIIANGLLTFGEDEILWMTVAEHGQAITINSPLE